MTAAKCKRVLQKPLNVYMIYFLHVSVQGINIPSFSHMGECMVCGYVVIIQRAAAV